MGHSIGVDESFEERPLIDRSTLHALQQRDDAATLLRLTLHLGALASTVVVLGSGVLPLWLALPAFVVLAALLATIFAPFHECTHRTAFASRRHNLIGAWITGAPWLLPPAVYRVFHFQHHRHTQDPHNDPELMGAPDVLSAWPQGLRAWLKTIPLHLLAVKLDTTLRCAFLPQEKWRGFASWGSPDDRLACTHDSRIMVALWSLVILAAIAGLDAAQWFLAAAFVSHTFLGLWLTTEHRGLPYDGTIMGRTRTTRSNRFVRWSPNTLSIT